MCESVMHTYVCDMCVYVVYVDVLYCAYSDCCSILCIDPQMTPSPPLLLTAPSCMSHVIKKKLGVCRTLALDTGLEK